MKHNLPRPKFSKILIDVLNRFIKKQKFYLAAVTSKMLLQMQKVVAIIKAHGIPKNLVLKRLPAPMGWGIFLRPDAKPIPKGTLISSYSGKAYLFPQNTDDDTAYAFAPIENITLKKSEQKKLDPKRPHSGRRKYIFNIDAQKVGNFTRFVNHSEHPNVVARLLKVPENNFGMSPAPIEVIFFALKKIIPGQQLLISYEHEESTYWGVLNITPIPILPDTFILDNKLNLIDHRKKSKR